MICHQCGHEMVITWVPGRLDTCSACSAYLHCCLNCRFYEPTLSNGCQEPQAEYVQDKAAGNYCEFFQPGTKVEVRRREAQAREARRAFEDLFR